MAQENKKAPRGSKIKDMTVTEIENIKAGDILSSKRGYELALLGYEHFVLGVFLERVSVMTFRKDGMFLQRLDWVKLEMVKSSTLPPERVAYIKAETRAYFDKILN